MESIAKTDVEKKLLELCSAQLEVMGYRIVDLDCRIGGKSLLRIFIERQRGQSEASDRVSLEDCVQVSRKLNEVVEAIPEIPGPFDLEVSSPGLDRRLRLRSDFEANCGTSVQLKFVDKIEGIGGQVRGILVQADDTAVTVESSEKRVMVPWAQIKQANRIWKTE